MWIKGTLERENLFGVFLKIHHAALAITRTCAARNQSCELNSDVLALAKFSVYSQLLPTAPPSAALAPPPPLCSIQHEDITLVFCCLLDINCACSHFLSACLSPSTSPDCGPYLVATFEEESESKVGVEGERDSMEDTWLPAL